jgi:hypothetical protein
MAPGRDPPNKRKVLGSAPRAEPRASDDSPSSGPAQPRAPLTAAAATGAQSLVDDLVRSFREQVRRALQVELDFSPTSLAFIDHYIRLAQSEDREAIVTLIAAGAGAYYGELVRTVIGGAWIGDGEDPRRLRLLVAPAFVYFSPIDQALQAIVAGSGLDDDMQVSAIDDAFHVAAGGVRDDGTAPESMQSDASWLEARMSELSPVPEDEFYTLTCRFETLQVMLELLAAKHAGEGRAPREYGIPDYLEVLGNGSR